MIDNVSKEQLEDIIESLEFRLIVAKETESTSVSISTFSGALFMSLLEENIRQGDNSKERPRGEWIARRKERWIGSEVCEPYTLYECSLCGKLSDRTYNFCPNCGAYMK